MSVIVWFRRDLRLADHAALAAAGDQDVVPVFVLDPRLIRSAAPARRDHLAASLRSLDEGIRAQGGAGLLVRTGDPVQVIPQVAAAHGSTQVLVSGDYSPFGVRRDRDVAAALAQAGVGVRSR